MTPAEREEARVAARKRDSSTVTGQPGPAAVAAPDAPKTQGSEDYHRTDAGNAERFANRYRAELAWVPGVGWHRWSNGRWGRADDSEVLKLSLQSARTLYNEARDADRDAQHAATKHAVVSLGRARIEAAPLLARGELLISADRLDCDPMLFNCRNGTVDLCTGTLRPHRQSDYLTKIAPVDYDSEADCPLWEAFLKRVVPSLAMRDFLRRAVGYTLSGDVGEQVIFFLHGTGSNGKSVFISTVQAMLGDYATTGAPDLLVERRNEAHPTDLAALRGRRMVVCAEIEQGKWLAEARLKSLTGGDVISARFMRQDLFTFEPTHKLWLFGNHQLRVRGTDNAIWRRIRQVPFEETIPENECDRDLPAKLRSELPGIVAWAVRGYLEWRRDGLAPPREVTEATEAYRKSQDRAGAFLAEACRVEPGERCTSAELYTAYSAWCSAEGEKVWTNTAFGTALRERGFTPRRTNRGKGWEGVSPLKVPGSAGSAGSSPQEDSYRTNRTTRHYPALSSAPDPDPEVS